MKSAAVLQHSTVFTALKHLYLCKGFKEDTFKKKKTAGSESLCLQQFM